MNLVKTIALPAALAYLFVRLSEMIIPDKNKGGMLAAGAGIAGAALGIAISNTVAKTVGLPKATTPAAALGKG